MNHVSVCVFWYKMNLYRGKNPWEISSDQTYRMYMPPNFYTSLTSSSSPLTVVDGRHRWAIGWGRALLTSFAPCHSSIYILLLFSRGSYSEVVVWWDSSQWWQFVAVPVPVLAWGRGFKHILVTWFSRCVSWHIWRGTMVCRSLMVMWQRFMSCGDDQYCHHGFGEVLWF